MGKESVPEPAVRRLSVYLRELEALEERGLRTVSSRQLGQAVGVSDAQVRKDLACFGQFGQSGVGYRVAELIHQLRRIFGTDRTWNVVLVGAGRLGMALAEYRGFAKKGFRLVAVFDNDPAKIGRPVPGLEDAAGIRPMDDLPAIVAQQDVRLGVVCVPAPAAQPVADALIAAGLRGLLNFAPVALSVPPGVAVVSVDLATQLEQLCFYVRWGVAGHGRS